MGLLVTALAHLHVRNLARKTRHAANDNTFSEHEPDHRGFVLAQKQL
jgi:hypothetical protein